MFPRSSSIFQCNTTINLERTHEIHLRRSIHSQGMLFEKNFDVSSLKKRTKKNIRKIYDTFPIRFRINATIIIFVSYERLIQHSFIISVHISFVRDVSSLKKRTKKKYSQNIWHFSYTISNKRNNNYFFFLWKIDTTFVYYIMISSYIIRKGCFFLKEKNKKKIFAKYMTLFLYDFE